MRQFILIIISSVFALVSAAQSDNPQLDTALANQLGADDYGMKMYVFAMLKTGPNTSTDKAFRDSCFTGHMSNMDKMVADGKLVVAGPFMKNDAELRGLFILNVPAIAEAEVLLQSDPAIKEGFLRAELFNWYGSAALPVYLDASDKVWRKSH
jgi:uncharacterized protein YciI